MVAKKVKLKRYEGNPILKPTRRWWETKWVYNNAAILDENKVKILYRARGEDYLSRFGYAESRDGFTIDFRSELPVFDADPENPYERLGVEDPRITKMGDTFYVVYIAISLYPSYKQVPSFNLSDGPPWRARAAIATTKDFNSFQRAGIILEDEDQKDAMLFPEKIGGKFVLLHRRYPDACIAYSEDLKNWEDHTVILTPRKGSWESGRVGGGAPPLKTEKGWLEFYHAADRDFVYRIGVMLLDLNDPTRIVAKLDYPVLEPEMDYEKNGPVPNVVFTCGVVEKEGQYLVYYGGADSVIGVATVDKEELLDALS